VHAQFVQEALIVLHLDKQVDVNNEYLNFRNDLLGEFDACFLLNVLHHIGDDYGDSALSKDQAKKELLMSLEYLSTKTKILVFQMGFNWKGNVNLPLFEHGTKREMIDFIRLGTAANWEVVHIGVASKDNGYVKYQELNNINIQRDNNLGEFLNRPLFILESKNRT
ncbi:MAG: hypothetical protein WAX04_06720, partial [Oscillospiraceae bacterium]